ncbi:MAG: hypothetical protein NTY37_02655 [Methanothrix sp.]|nr:hypothetical protein [Methanothrix sp.]
MREGQFSARALGLLPAEPFLGSANRSYSADPPDGPGCPHAFLERRGLGPAQLAAWII